MEVLIDDAVLIEKRKKAGEPYVITVNCPNKTGLGCNICHTILEFGLYPSPCASSSPIYLLKFCSLDMRGLLHDMTQVFDEPELTIQRVKLTTTPDDSVLDLFFIKDNLELLHTKERQDEMHEHLYDTLGESCISCKLQLACPQYDNLQGITSLSPTVAEELFSITPSGKETRSQALCSYANELKRASINCVDHKGFLYNIMRTLKDSNIQQKHGKKIVDPKKQDALCSRLKLELFHLLRVLITNRGPDTQLLVANPVELSGRRRPRVFYDVTFALKSFGICIFSISRDWKTFSRNHEWEVYKFLLDKNCNFQLSCMVIRNQIVDKVVRTLMGW
ncbi:hypothetical protein Pfo_007089 [Paulownia fortunei]|nr:hypothetical protein Pfo_007089 [Paulownia fortunei]